MGMHIKFTYHAQFRLHERKFTTEQMKSVILNPDFTRQAADGKIVSKKKFNNDTLEVVYIIKKGVFVIITVYYN